MHAFDFILVLFSFVYAAAVTHVLSTGRDHHRLQAYPAIVVQCGLDLVALLFTCAPTAPMFYRSNYKRAEFR